MPKRSYKGDKRRREIAKQKKRQEKLNRQHGSKADGEEGGEDNSYLEYLHPGGLPEELQPDEPEEGEDGKDPDTRPEA